MEDRFAGAVTLHGALSRALRADADLARLLHPDVVERKVHLFKVRFLFCFFQFLMPSKKQTWVYSYHLSCVFLCCCIPVLPCGVHVVLCLLFLVYQVLRAGFSGRETAWLAHGMKA